MATYKNFEELEIWQLARELCKAVDLIVDDTWYRKDSSLKAQILSSSGSVMDNIAEGFERGSTKEFISFLSYSKGSCGEMRSQLYRAFDKKLIDENTLNKVKDQSIEISRKLNKFMAYLSNVDYKGNRFLEPEVEYLATENNLKLQISNNICDRRE